jgi:hypothetical protein
MNPKISLENTIKAFFWVKTNFIFFAFLKAKSELHKMILHVNVDHEIVLKYLDELI